MSISWRGLAAGIAALGGLAAASAPASAQTNWSSLYFGGHAGYVSSDYNWTWDLPTLPASGGPSVSNSSFGAGAHLGLQHQWGNTVAGIEVGWTGNNMGWNRSVINFVSGFDRNFDSHTPWTGTITPKLGWSMGNLLAYVKGGYAFGPADLKTSRVTDGLLQTSSTGMLHGWTAGAGLEWMVISNVSLGIEYDFVRLNGETRSDVNFAPTIQSNHFLGDIDSHQVMARLSIHLGRPAPVVEAMK